MRTPQVGDAEREAAPRLRRDFDVSGEVAAAVNARESCMRDMASPSLDCVASRLVSISPQGLVQGLLQMAKAKSPWTLTWSVVALADPVKATEAIAIRKSSNPSRACEPLLQLWLSAATMRG